MSAYSTREITREEAEEMVRRVRAKIRGRDRISLMTDEELDTELHEYVYSEKHNEIVGCLYNYMILPDKSKN